MWNQRQNVQFSIPYPLICPIIWWRHYSSLLVCMYVTNFSQKLLDRIARNFQGWFVIIQGQSIIVWERSGQKLRSRSQKGKKCILVIKHSVFVQFIWNQPQNVQFSIPYPLTNVALAKVCALPSACSSSVCVFRIYFHPSQSIATNESMVGLKRTLHHQQHMPDKKSCTFRCHDIVPSWY